MGRLRTSTVALLGTAVLAACGGAGGDGQAQPAPTVTVTVTETATPAAEDDPTATRSPDGPSRSSGTGNDDPCGTEELEAFAFIFVTSPVPGAELSSGDEVTGCSNTFEASYQYELLDRDGAVLDEGFGTASCGTGCVGELAFPVEFAVDEVTVGTLRVYATSAQDGSEELVNAIPVRLQP